MRNARAPPHHPIRISHVNWRSFHSFSVEGLRDARRPGLALDLRLSKRTPLLVVPPRPDPLHSRVPSHLSPTLLTCLPSLETPTSSHQWTGRAKPISRLDLQPPTKERSFAVRLPPHDRASDWLTLPTKRLKGAGRWDCHSAAADVAYKSGRSPPVMSQGWVNNAVSYNDLVFTTDPSEIVKAAKDICYNEPRELRFNYPWEMSRIKAFEDLFQSEGTEKPVFVYSTSTNLPWGHAYSKRLMLFGFSGGTQRDQSAINVHFGSLAYDGGIRTEPMSLDEPRSLSASIWESLDLKERPREDPRSPVKSCFLPIIADNFSTVLERMCSLRAGVSSRLEALKSCAADQSYVAEELGDDFTIAPNTSRLLQILGARGLPVDLATEDRLYKMHADIYPPPDDITKVPRASNPVLTAFAVRGDYLLSASRPLDVFTGDGNDTVLAFWHVDAADKEKTYMSSNRWVSPSNRSQSRTYVLRHDSYPEEIHTMCRRASLHNSGAWESTIHDLLDQSTFVDEESRQRFKEVASDLGATLDDELINGGGKAGLLHQAFHGLQGFEMGTIEGTEWVNTDAEGKQTAGYFVDPNDSIFTAPVRAKGRPEA